VNGYEYVCKDDEHREYKPFLMLWITRLLVSEHYNATALKKDRLVNTIAIVFSLKTKAPF